MSEFEVVWSGRGPIPGIRSEGWAQTRNVLMEQAQSNGQQRQVAKRGEFRAYRLKRR